MVTSDVHFILGHIHQGVIEKTEWAVEDLYKELQRLQQHVGFPNRQFLNCPILIQDKIVYLRCTEVTNPTLRVSIPKIIVEKIGGTKTFLDNLAPDEISTISSWCAAHDEGFGWVLKAPYTTNKSCRHFCPTIEEVLNKIRLIGRRYGPIQYKVASLGKVLSDYRDRAHPIIPYLMIQPCMRNTMEYKVVLLNGEAISETGFSRARSKCFGTLQSRMKWAEKQVQTLHEKCPHALLDGLVRVDFFCDINGKWVVNEFESLEADIFSEKPKIQMQAQSFLRTYWLQKILNIFQKD